MSKRLDTILSKVPSATASKIEKDGQHSMGLEEKTERIVAVIPASVKKEIRLYMANNFKETERTIILRGLKAIGFNVKDKELVDKRGVK